MSKTPKAEPCGGSFRNAASVSRLEAALALLASSAEAGAIDIEHEACKAPASITGAALFAENCTVCHGRDGKGGGVLAATLALMPPISPRLRRARIADFRRSCPLCSSKGGRKKAGRR